MPDKQQDAPSGPGEVLGLDKRQLLTRHQGGDPNAFRELMEMYRAPVYTYLVRCGVSNDVRDDLFQEVFLKIHLGAAAYAPDKPLNPWLFTIVANTVRSHYRKQRVRKLLQSKGEGEVEAGSAEEILEAGETASWLNQSIKALPFNQREVLVLSSLKNMDHADIAQTLDIPLNTVKTNLRRARLTLAKSLARKRLKEQNEVKQ